MRSTKDSQPMPSPRREVSAGSRTGGQLYGAASRADAVDALVASVLGPSGISDAGWRVAAYDRGRAIARGATQPEARTIGSLPCLLAQLVDDVARAPHTVTDEQFEALYAAGYSADVLYEMTLAVAAGAGVERRTIGLEAIAAWEAAAGRGHGS